MRARRSDLDIIKDVLEECLDAPRMKSSIMYKANLSYRQVEIYLKKCIDRGFLKNQIEGSRVVYTTTEKGIKFLEAFYLLQDLLKSEQRAHARVMVKKDES